MTKAQARSGGSVEQVPISDIKIGPRQRKALGSLASIVKSIREHGLFQPIMLEEDNVLRFGARRLEACRRVGWKTIPCQRWEGLSEDEKKAIEVEENSQRKPLTPHETSKQTVREWEAELEAAKEEAAEKGNGELRGKSPQKSKGRPKDPASKRSTSKKSGVSRRTASDATEHVAIADEFPVMKSKDWAQANVLTAGKHLKKIGTDLRATFGAMISEPSVPVRTALGILQNVSELPKPERNKIAELYNSGDPRKEDLAKTRAAKVPPSPPRHLICIRSLSEQLHTEVRKAPKRHHAELRHVDDLLQKIVHTMSEEYQTLKTKELSR